VTEHGVTPIGGKNSIAHPGAARRAQPTLLSMPNEPPPGLQQEYEAAARVIEDLAARHVNLHFEVDQATDRVRVQMLDSSGNVIREIPASSLLDSLSGGGLLIDERG